MDILGNENIVQIQYKHIYIYIYIYIYIMDIFDSVNFIIKIT